MKLIGLTGNIACGKSKISAYLKEHGFKIIDADSLGKIILSREEVKNKVVRTFGKEILKDDFVIDRKKLGNIVFSSRENLEKLNRITLPPLTKLVKSKIRELKRKKVKYGVLDAAILIEASWDRFVHEIWVVYAKPEVQLERLMKRENFTKEEALKRINAQMPIEEKIKRADVVIDNSGDWEETKKQVDKALKRFLEDET